MIHRTLAVSSVFSIQQPPTPFQKALPLLTVTPNFSAQRPPSRSPLPAFLLFIISMLSGLTASRCQTTGQAVCIHCVGKTRGKENAIPIKTRKKLQTLRYLYRKTLRRRRLGLLTLRKKRIGKSSSGY